ncbi:hypothetical protein [Isoptericola croceus]|uniref:hypothetical protein n=1 Tax=Isoptericola croceus TaxID=3031406 RepID=UPI0023F850C7|nr:hypothetical protein [Isoptericola croceus]
MTRMNGDLDVALDAIALCESATLGNLDDVEVIVEVTDTEQVTQWLAPILRDMLVRSRMGTAHPSGRSLREAGLSDHAIHQIRRCVVGDAIPEFTGTPVEPAERCRQMAHAFVCFADEIAAASGSMQGTRLAMESLRLLRERILSRLRTAR